MGQQVVDNELGILRLIADMNRQHRTIGKGNHTVKLQRNGDPLVFTDAAIVMGLEICQLRILIQGSRFQIQTGCVGVGGGDIGAAGQRLLADHRQHDALSAVVAIHLIACFQGHTGLERYKPPLLGQLDAVLHAKALGLAVVQKVLIGLAIIMHGGLFRLIETVIPVLRGIQQGLAQLAFFTHGMVPPYISFVFQERARLSRLLCRLVTA